MMALIGRNAFRDVRFFGVEGSLFSHCGSFCVAFFLQESVNTTTTNDNGVRKEINFSVLMSNEANTTNEKRLTSIKNEQSS